MMIGSYPYLLNPSGMGGVYAAAVASQPVQPIAPVSGQSNSSIITFGGALSSVQAEGPASSGQGPSRPYAPGNALDITV